MLNWLTNNFGTLLVLLALGAVVAAIVIYMVREKRQGKSSCGAGCAHCAMAGMCHKSKQA